MRQSQRKIHKSTTYMHKYEKQKQNMKPKNKPKNMITNIHIRVSWKIFMDRLYHI